MYLVETASLNHIQPQLAGCKNIHLATLGPNKMINFPTITFLNYSVALHVKTLKIRPAFFILNCTLKYAKPKAQTF